jgi:hypothetical protein
MTVTATSSMARAIASAIDLIASSSTFQTRVGAANAAAAKAHIYGYETYIPADGAGDEDQSPLRPCATIDIGENFDWDAIAAGCTHIRLDVSGAVVVILEDNANLTWVNEDSDDDYNDSFLDFLNFCGGVIDDMSGKLHDSTLDTFGFQSVSMLSPPFRASTEARTAGNDHWFAVFGLKRQGVG